MTIDNVVPERTLVGESPVWSEPEGLLYWVDIEGRKVHRYDPASGVNETVAVDDRPGCVALTEEPGRLVVGSEVDVGFFSWDSGDFQSLVQVEPAGTGNRLNDGRATPEGRLIVGSMFENTRADRFSGQVHVVGPDASHQVIRREVGVANGQAFSPDGRLYYFADSPHRTVLVSDWDADAGRPVNERTFFEFGDLPGKPDGATVDAEGCYWVACVRGAALARITPDGRLDRLVELPFGAPTMPAFGGPDLSTLFVTSISATEPDADGQLEPGGLFALDVGVSGFPQPHFG